MAIGAIFHFTESSPYCAPFLKMSQCSWLKYLLFCATKITYYHFSSLHEILPVALNFIYSMSIFLDSVSFQHNFLLAFMQCHLYEVKLDNMSILSCSDCSQFLIEVAIVIITMLKYTPCVGYAQKLIELQDLQGNKHLLCAHAILCRLAHINACE